MSQDNGDAKAFIADLVARSRAAQRQIEHYSQEQVDALIRATVSYTHLTLPTIYSV